MSKVYLGIGSPGPVGPPGAPGIVAGWKGLWSSGTTYHLGDGVQGSDGEAYVSNVDPNLNHDPVGDGGVNWNGPLSGTPTEIDGGILGASLRIDAARKTSVWLTGTLTANHALRIDNTPIPGKVTLLVSQDGLGGHTLTVTDGIVSPISVVVAEGPGAPTIVEIFSTATGWQIRTDAQAPSNIYDGLIARWKGSDLAGAGASVASWPDNTGNGWTLTTPGGPQPTSQTAGGIKVVRFVGTERLDSTLVPANLGSSVGRPLSQFAVVNPLDYATGTELTIFGSSNSGGPTLRLNVSADGPGTPGVPDFVKTGLVLIQAGTIAIPTGRLSVVGVTYDAAGVCSLYVNGVLAGQTTNAQDFTAQPLRVGNQPSYGGAFFRGDTPDLLIYGTDVAQPIDLCRALMAEYGIAP